MNLYLDILLGICLILGVVCTTLFFYELACKFNPKMHGLSILFEDEKGEE